MTPALEFHSSCPPWCAGHDDAQEPCPPRWHRSEGITLPLTERRRPPLGGNELAPVTTTEYVVALEKDARTTYVYLGPLDEAHRFIAITPESARELRAALDRLLNELDGTR